MDREELAGFLRSRRERIAPAETGLLAGPRRRTPGLRREEVAQLAYISTEYYTRLEQARAPHPSREVLAQLARALRLSDTERDHLHHLAGTPPRHAPGPSHQVRRSIVDLLDRLPQTAALVVSATYEVLAWNALAAALFEDFSALPRWDRNLARRALTDPPRGGGQLYGFSARDEFVRTMTQQLRAAAARYPDDPEVTGLVAELRRTSDTFARYWDAHDVAARPSLDKTFDHPLVGRLTVACDVLDIADRDQRVFFYTATPGSRSAEALRLLSNAGPQRREVSG